MTDHIPYPPFGGTPLRNYNLLRRITKEHEVWVATVVTSGEEANSIPHLVKCCQGVETVETKQVGGLERPIEAIRYLLKGIPLELRLYQNKEMINKIKWLVRETGFDVVEIVDSFMGMYLEALPMEMRARTVLTFIDVVFSKDDRISRLEPKMLRKMGSLLYSRMMRRWEPFYYTRGSGQYGTFSRNASIHVPIHSFANSTTSQTLVASGQLTYAQVK